MIKIEIFEDNQGRIVGFEVRGHAMGPDRVDSYDLVCCGVSVLTLTTVNGLTDYLCVTPQELSVEDGWLKFLLPVGENGELSIEEPFKLYQVDALFGSMVLGLQEMACDHPNFIQLRKRRWTSC